jgi:protein farnesyltransferase subunit beta
MPRATPDDGYPTPTSREQRETEARISNCLPPPGNESTTATYTLDRKAHLNYVARNLFQGFPRHYVYQDASQPWFMFWLFQSFSLLGAGFDPDNKQR